MELYALNEAGRFPEGGVEQYEKALRDQTEYFLVAENEGQVIASGGMSYYMRENIAVFCFGMVRPSHHGGGVGTALFLARLALLNPKRPTYQVFIFALEKSIGFYRRFGFEGFIPWEDVHGQRHPTGHLRTKSSEIRRCQTLLREHGIEFPQDEDKIPFRKELQVESYQSRCRSCGGIVNPIDDICKKCGRPMW